MKREIKLQRQFLQLGRDVVEFKQFKQIEDGRINNKTQLKIQKWLNI